MEKKNKIRLPELKERFNQFDFNGFDTMSDTIKVAKNYVADARSGNRIVFPTKWPRYNRQLMGGLQPGKMYVIGGRPGSGKSQFSNQMLFDVLDLAEDNGHKMLVFYWSFEMPGYQQLMRIASGDLKTSVYDLIQESTDKILLNQFNETLNKFQDYPIAFYNIPATLIQFKNKITQFCKNNEDVTVINVIDHTRLFKGGNKEEMQRIADVTKALMEVQAEYQTISVLLSQLNRNIESNDRANNQYQPLLSDIFGSDAVGQDAHVVTMLNRPFDMYNIEENYCGEVPKGLMACHIVKNREGELGMVPLNTHYPSFRLTERPRK
jgi:replicative DNA helicase